MWWKKHTAEPEGAQRGAQLEAATRDEPSLALIARLQGATAQEIGAPESFKQRLEEQLLAQHGAQTGARSRSWQRKAFDFDHWWLAVPILLLLFVVAYGLRETASVAKVDDWQYMAAEPSVLNYYVSGHPNDVLPGWASASMQEASVLFGTIFLASLLFLVLRSLYLWVAQPRRISPVWGRLAVRTMVVSLGMVLVFAGANIGLQRGAAQMHYRSSLMGGSQLVLRSYTANQMAPDASLGRNFMNSSRIGFSVDGAKDAGNFRKNLAAGYLPLPTDVTPEGLFYDYTFDTGEETPCAELFCPSYAVAVSPDPISGAPQTFLAVGLNSGIAENDFQRKHLNLVIVLDNSDSMNATFDHYYYDANNPYSEPRRPEDGGFGRANSTKIENAAAAVTGLLDHLAPEDRLGIVLFNDEAHLAKPMRRVQETDLTRLRDHLAEIRAHGGTNLESGYQLATQLLAPMAGQDPEQYETRIIVLTDAQPNTGTTTEGGLLEMTRTAAEQGIYTTFVGIGVDFNTILIESISKVRGANYYAVHSADEFLKRMDDGFDYMVTPLVFDLDLVFAADDYEIERVYGAPLADRATGRILQVNTLFPAEPKEGEVRGGLILLQLARREGRGASTASATLTVYYRDRAGQAYENTVAMPLPRSDEERYDNLGIRKGILLARYAGLLQQWLKDAHGGATKTIVEATPAAHWDSPLPTPSRGIGLGQWERTSAPLVVSPAYRDIFTQFKAYVDAEAAAIGDPILQQEVDVLERLVK